MNTFVECGADSNEAKRKILTFFQIFFLSPARQNGKGEKKISQAKKSKKTQTHTCSDSEMVKIYHSASIEIDVHKIPFCHRKSSLFYRF